MHRHSGCRIRWDKINIQAFWANDRKGLKVCEMVPITFRIDYVENRTAF